jgi:hypothetical protein
MDDDVGMQIADGLSQLKHVTANFVERKASVLAVVHRIVDGAIRAILHDNVALPALLEGGVVLDDVRVVERLVDPDLLVDAIQAMRVISMINALHRNFRLPDSVESTADGGKPALANDFTHLEFLKASGRMRVREKN